jgi:transmembrane sensor
MTTKSSVTEQAARWLFALETSDYFEEIWPPFQAWLQEDVRHREAYLALEKAWRQVASLGGLGSDNELKDPDILFKMAPRAKSSAVIATWANARAIGAIVSLTMAAIPVWRGSGALQQPIASAVRRLLLAPEDSTLTLPGPSRALRVQEHRSRGSGVLQGEVLLTARRDPAESPVILEAGQGAFIDEEGVHRQTLDPATARERLLWREGKLAFPDETLAQAVAELNRYNRQKVQIDDPDVANMSPPGGVYETADPAGFAEAAKRALGIDYETIDSGEFTTGAIYLRRGHRQ